VGRDVVGINGSSGCFPILDVTSDVMSAEWWGGA
jgi:hypothetical protein